MQGVIDSEYVHRYQRCRVSFTVYVMNATSDCSAAYSKAIKESVQIMDPDEEYITIASAEEQMSMTEAARKKEIDETRARMKGECQSICRLVV